MVSHGYTRGNGIGLGRRTNGIPVDESNEGLTTIWICEASGVGSRDSAILSELS